MFVPEFRSSLQDQFKSRAHLALRARRVPQVASNLAVPSYNSYIIIDQLTYEKELLAANRIGRSNTSCSGTNIYGDLGRRHFN